MHLSFRLINVSIGNVGTPLSPLCCAGIDNLPQQRLPALQPALLALPGKSQPGAPHSSHFSHARRHGAAQAPWSISCWRRGKTSTHSPCSKLSAGQSWEGFCQHVLLTNPCCPQAAVCHHSASTDPSVALGQLSLQQSTRSYLNNSNLYPGVSERQFFSKWQQRFP